MQQQTSELSTIVNYPKEPIPLFKSILERINDKLILLNLATVDSEFGVLNRTIVYRGLVDDNIVFVTERNSRKYDNLRNNSRVSVTFFFPYVPTATCEMETWQIRLIDAEAKELNDQEIASFWEQESLFAKIRSHIAKCGKPVDHGELQQRHKQLLAEYQNGSNELDQTNTYTVFKILANRWDFYKSEENKIADRVQYRRQCDENSSQWEVFHVEP